MRRTGFRYTGMSVVLVALAAAPAAAQLKATLVASGFDSPVAFVQDPADPTVQVVVEQTGRVRVLENGVVQSTDFLNLTSQLPAPPLVERGLLGFAFAPDFATSGRVFACFTNTSGNSVIARFTRSTANPLQADVSTRFDFVWPGGLAYITQPFTNHNGGNLVFGPDGYLYVGFGDGGSGNDPNHNAQNPQMLLGKMLRLDVSVPDTDAHGYAVPPTNPFVGQSGILPEIWDFGMRNPWRWSFDYPHPGSTGALVIGDVGQDAWEEVDYEPMGKGGRNYGWGNREGATTNAAYTGGPPPALAPQPLRDPVYAYSHSDGHAVIGGVVYRGRILGPMYVGRYFFGDNSNSRVWSLGLTLDSAGEATAGTLLEHTSELGAGANSPSAFGTDAAGEIYIVSYGGGAIYRVDRASGSPPDGCSAVDPYLAAGGGVCAAGVWHPPGRGSDFNGDQHADLLFQSTANQMYAWYMAGHALATGSWLSPDHVDPNWQVVGTADLTGDDRPDVLLQNQVTGAVTLLPMNGVSATGTQTIPLAANSPWRVMATADFNRDGRADLIWQNASTGQLFVWFMGASGGAAFFQSGAYVVDINHVQVQVSGTWRIVGAADLNGDGAADLLWEDDAGNLAAWYMDGATATAAADVSPARVNPAWRIKAVADFNGDQHPDLVWENPSTGDLYLWYMVGSQFAHGDYLQPSRVNVMWQVAGPK